MAKQTITAGKTPRRQTATEVARSIKMMFKGSMNGSRAAVARWLAVEFCDTRDFELYEVNKFMDLENGNTIFYAEYCDGDFRTKKITITPAKMRAFRRRYEQANPNFIPETWEINLNNNN